MARLGKARAVNSGKRIKVCFPKRRASCGKAWHGKARRGKARQGKGRKRQIRAIFGSPFFFASQKTEVDSHHDSGNKRTSRNAHSTHQGLSERMGEVAKEPLITQKSGQGKTPGQTVKTASR